MQSETVMTVQKTGHHPEFSQGVLIGKNNKEDRT